MRSTDVDCRAAAWLVIASVALVPLAAASGKTTILEPRGARESPTVRRAVWQSTASGAFRAAEHRLRPVISIDDGASLIVTLPEHGSLTMRPLEIARTNASATLPAGDGAAEPSGRHRDGRLVVLGSWLGVDEVFELEEDGVKHELVVSESALDLLGGGGDLRASWRIEMSSELELVLEGSRGAVLRDRAGDFVARIPLPVLVDSAHSHAANIVGRLQVSGGDGSHRLDIIVPSQWLDDPARVFPLRIDPTISTQPTGFQLTGWVDGQGNRQDGAIVAGSLADFGFGSDVRGFAEFDTSGIPDGAVITDVRLQVWVSNHDNPGDPAVPLALEIKEVTTKTNVATSTLYGAIPGLGSAVTYVADSIPRTGPDFCPGSFEFRDYDLGSQADGTLQSQLGADFFTVGMVSQIVTDPGFDHVDLIGYPETVQNGNCSTQNFPRSRITLIVSYEDNRPPTCDAGGPYFSACPDVPVALDGRGSSDPDNDPLDYSWTTNCPGSISNPNQAQATLALVPDCSASCDVTLRISDAEFERSCTTTVSAQDQQAPVLVGVPGDVTVQCDAIPAVVNPGASDTCDPAPTVTYVGESRIDGTCPDSYTLVRTWRATDRCGNASEASQTITVVDTEPPALSIAGDVTVECDDVPAVGDVSVTDNCDPAPDVVFLGEERTDGSCPDSYTLLRTWRATDRCGNAVELSQLITVVDTEPPQLTVASDVTVECDAVPPVAAVQVVDNCDPDPAVTYLGETRVDGDCPDSYTLTRTWSAIDRCGNAVELQQVITVVDSTPPEVVIAADETVHCDAIPAVAAATVSDNCDPDPDLVYVGETRVDGDCEDRYTLTRTWRGTDRCGNVSTVEQVITVTDDVAPEVFGVPADVTVECDAVPIVTDPTATDDCDPAPQVTYLGEDRIDGSCDDNYTLTRRWRAQDRCGNFTDVEQVITVVDTTAPQVFDVPTDVTVECDAVPPVVNPTATDNCDSAPVVSYLGEDRLDGDCDDSYTLTRRWRAQDRCGNFTDVEQVITVVDTTAPEVFDVPADVTVECDALPPVGSPTATDNCDPAPTVTYLGETRVDGVCDHSYVLTRRWRATDRCGNATDVAQEITVVDTTAPTLSGVPSDVTVECDAVPTPAQPTASDNCDSAPTIVMIETRIDGACDDTYTLVREWTATDDCGNSTTASQTVTVQDTTFPVLDGVPADATVECDAIPAPADVVATDNCDPAPILVLTETRIDGSCDDNYVIVREWTATDRCGHVTSATQRLTVVDTTAPVLSGVPGDVTVECDAVPPAAMPSASDNCDPAPTVVLVETRVDGRCEDEYELVREWMATDRCGNVSVAVQRVMVVDTTAPGVMGVPPDETVECDAVPAEATPTASDNCDPSPVLMFVETRLDGTCEDSYELVREWTATDRCDNASVYTQILTVQDSQPPAVIGVLQPTMPLPPQSAASARSVCSAATSREFRVVCDTVDNCDPLPSLDATLVVSNHVVGVDGTCELITEEVDVSCDELVEIHLLAPPCPPRPTSAPQSTVTVNSQGIQVVRGENVTLVVVSEDRCGNIATVEYDPSEEPSPLCDEVLDDGTCCPAIGQPEADCRDMPPCGTIPVAERRQSSREELEHPGGP